LVSLFFSIMNLPEPFPDSDSDSDADHVDVEDDVEVDILAHQRFLRICERVNSVEQGAHILDLHHEDWSVWPLLPPTSFLKNLLFDSLDRNHTTLTKVGVGFNFLRGTSEDEQRHLYRALGNTGTLRELSFLGPLEPNDWTILLESMPRLLHGISILKMQSIVLGNQLEVELLADAVGYHGKSLEAVSLLVMVSRVNENRMGFLDPILRSMPAWQPPVLELYCYQGQALGPSLITVEALRSFLQSQVNFTGDQQRGLGLLNLGIGDDHCKSVAELFVKHDRAPDRAIGALDLRRNPAIGHEGYEAILGLLNREHWIGKVSVDDQSWQAKISLVAEMNTEHGRGEFLQDGAFDSKAAWVDWIARLVALDENVEADDARRLSFLWYTLTEKPEFISP
jgi:hypothetical protein